MNENMQIVTILVIMVLVVSGILILLHTIFPYQFEWVTSAISGYSEDKQRCISECFVINNLSDQVRCVC